MTRDTSNDTRGWVLCLISAVACVAGACLVGVDVLVRLLPGQRAFRIQDSSAFLSASLSLSFGVMIFSALYSMLPSAKRYLLRGGWSEQDAGLLLLLAFATGFVGMQAVSRVIHRFMPSHVVDCDHTHEHERENEREHEHHDHDHHDHEHHGESVASPTETSPLLSTPTPTAEPTDLTLRRQPSTHSQRSMHSHSLHSDGEPSRVPAPVHGHVHDYDHDHAHDHARHGLRSKRSVASLHRASMAEIQKRVLSFVQDVKTNCDESGPCFGYTDPCGQECKKAPVGPALVPALAPAVTPAVTPAVAPEHDARDHEEMREGDPTQDCASLASDPERGLAQHHHVPANAFLSIGLQTVLAIGLHKFPEGFIAFATNHANPALGFNVFLALFVHNIAEGFAMALPLYMALGSRVRAILWAAALGGLSQPVGAGVAALWLSYLGRNNDNNGDNTGGGQDTDVGTAYGVLFAGTAGIMVAVALQLFVESLTLHHNRQLSTGFAFVGMLMLGLSNAIGAH